MKEDFLYFLWQTQNFDKTQLATTTGERLQILSIGQHNTNAGPDFLNARLIIGDIEWAGAVEMHLKASDWDKHRHTQDPAYDAVILHLVWQNDTTITRSDGTVVPTLELVNITNKSLLEKYEKLLRNETKIPCEAHFNAVSDILKMSMLDRVLMQRLERKAQIASELHAANKQDWEETAYQLLAQNFGFKINAEPFLRLAQGLPLKVIQKHRDSLRQIEALLFGQAGFLDNPVDEYSEQLKKEYDFLAAKYSLANTQLLGHEWKFLRLRPANFPTIRLSQMAALLHQQSSLFSLFINTKNVAELTNIMRLKPSEYWQNHYQIGKKTEQKVPQMGRNSVENVVINTIVPLLVAYSQHKDQPDFLDQATALLETLPAEHNNITDHWQSLGVNIKTAFDSQASIELFNNFCSSKKCMSCVIGTSILK